jgi:hypothetical protein
MSIDAKRLALRRVYPGLAQLGPVHAILFFVLVILADVDVEAVRVDRLETDLVSTPAQIFELTFAGKGVGRQILRAQRKQVGWDTVTRVLIVNQALGQLLEQFASTPPCWWSGAVYVNDCFPFRYSPWIDTSFFAAPMGEGTNRVLALLPAAS